MTIKQVSLESVFTNNNTNSSIKKIAAQVIFSESNGKHMSKQLWLEVLIDTNGKTYVNYNVRSYLGEVRYFVIDLLVAIDYYNSI